MDYACNWRGGGRGGCRRLAERWRGAPALGCDRSSAAIARGAGRTAASPCRALPRLGRVAALGSLIPRRRLPGRGDWDGGGSPPDVCEGCPGGAGDTARRQNPSGSAIWPGPTVGSVPDCPVPTRARTHRGRVAPAGALRYCSGAPPAGHSGGVAERLKAHAWRACMGATPSRVRIPLPPPTPWPPAFTREHTSPENSWVTR